MGEYCSYTRGTYGEIINVLQTNEEVHPQLKLL